MEVLDVAFGENAGFASRPKKWKLIGTCSMEKGFELGVLILAG